jgi:hypothetical protein
MPLLSEGKVLDFSPLGRCVMAGSILLRCFPALVLTHRVNLFDLALDRRTRPRDATRQRDPTILLEHERVHEPSIHRTQDP